MRSTRILGSMAILGLMTACNCRSKCCDEGEVVVKQSYVHKYGVEIDPVNWNQRGGDGQVVSTQKNGVTVKQNYANGILQGQTYYTFPHSSDIEKISLYENGNLLSETTNFPSGEKKMVIEYAPTNPDILVISEWYENGNKKSREAYLKDILDVGTYYDIKGNVESKVASGTGSRIERDDFGQLISSDSYKDGKVTETIYYHPNKSIKEVVPYVNGTIEGNRKIYFAGGDPDRFEEWKNGRQEGVTTIFQHGEKAAEVPYVNGQKNGVEKRFRDGTYVVEEVTWVAGRQNGPHTMYVGDQKNVDWYFHDKHVSRTQYERMLNPQMR